MFRALRAGLWLTLGAWCFSRAMRLDPGIKNELHDRLAQVSGARVLRVINGGHP